MFAVMMKENQAQGPWLEQPVTELQPLGNQPPPLTNSKHVFISS